MIQEYVNNHNLKYTWCRLYELEHGQEIARFDCFYKATEYINNNNLNIVYLENHIKQKGQSWGVRPRS